MIAIIMSVITKSVVENMLGYTLLKMIEKLPFFVTGQYCVPHF
jgi:hypothetical protein